MKSLQIKISIILIIKPKYRMGSSQSKQNSLQSLEYTEKKRQNNPIIGQSILIYNTVSKTYHTVKTISNQNLTQYKQLCNMNSQVRRYPLCCYSSASQGTAVTIKQEQDNIRSRANLQMVKQTKENNYVGVVQILQDRNSSGGFFMHACSMGESYTVVLDNMEIDLENIQYSKYFIKFKQQDFVNIILCVLQGIIVLQNRKMNVFPICKKSVILNCNSEEYMGEDLSKAVFKIVPLSISNLFNGQNKNKEINKLWTVPPEIEQNIGCKSQFYSHYTPNNHIYSLGMMILDLIYDQQRVRQAKPLDFSFANTSNINKSKQVNSSEILNTSYNNNGSTGSRMENKMKILQNSNEFSQKFMQIIKMMVQNRQQDRIGFTSLYQICQLMKLKLQNKNRCRKHIKLHRNPSSDNKLTKKQFYVVKKTNKSNNKIVNQGVTVRKSTSNCLVSSSSNFIQNLKQDKILSDLTNNHINTQRKNAHLQQDKNNMGKTIFQSPTNPINKKNQFILRNPKIQQKQSNQKSVQNGKFDNQNFYYKQKPLKVFFENGAYYEGEFNQLFNFDGFGTLYYSQTKICYTGYWKNNLFDGFGYLFNKIPQKTFKKFESIPNPQLSTFQNQNSYLQNQNMFVNCQQINYKDFCFDYDEKNKQILWQHYQGQFKFDKKEGYGVLYFVDGSKFQGEFKNNKAQGFGAFTTKKGKRINGVWKNNKLVNQIL